MSEYNHKNFPLDMQVDDFKSFRNGPNVGQSMPDCMLVETSTGNSVKLSDYWKIGPVFIEFGSIT